MHHFLNKGPWYSDRAVYSDLYPLDGGQSLYQMDTVRTCRWKLRLLFTFQPSPSLPCELLHMLFRTHKRLAPWPTSQESSQSFQSHKTRCHNPFSEMWVRNLLKKDTCLAMLRFYYMNSKTTLQMTDPNVLLFGSGMYVAKESWMKLAKLCNTAPNLVFSLNKSKLFDGAVWKTQKSSYNFIFIPCTTS